MWEVVIWRRGSKQLKGWIVVDTMMCFPKHPSRVKGSLPQLRSAAGRQLFAGISPLWGFPWLKSIAAPGVVHPPRDSLQQGIRLDFHPLSRKTLKYHLLWVNWGFCCDCIESSFSLSSILFPSLPFSSLPQTVLHANLCLTASIPGT